jgi:hypothetical protein
VTAIWRYSLSAFHDWASWRKLEPGLRAAIANRDLDLAAWYCDRYRIAAVTPAISSIILEIKTSTVATVAALARVKRAWRAASRTHLSKLTAPIKYFQVAAFVFPLAALTAIAVDLAQYFQDPIHRYVTITSRVASSLPLLILSLAVSVLCFVFQQCMEARAQELKRIIDDLATALVLSFLDGENRRGPAAYQPGSWMHLTETDPNTMAAPEECPE